MKPTPEMIEAARSVLCSNGGARPLIPDSHVEKALTAALALMPGEPVAVSWVDSTGCEHVTTDVERGKATAVASGYDVSPLYASPAPLPVAGDEWLTRLLNQLDVLSGYHIVRPVTPDDEFVRVCNGDLRKMVEILDAQPPIRDQHPDDIAVDRFAAAMKAKLAKKRAEGYGGWEDKDECSQIFLSQLLREHVEKGDPVDVGNIAMMLHQREERIV